METVRMFVNGQAMRKGSLHHALSDAEFVGPVKTAPRYRFVSFGDFPGLLPVTDGGGACIEGELYALHYAQLREHLLPNEPPELELSAIELADGRGSLSMVVRASAVDSGEDITGYGSWRSYLERGSSW